MIEEVIQYYLGDPNDEYTRSQIKRDLHQLDIEGFCEISVNHTDPHGLLIRIYNPFEEIWYRL